MNTAFKEKLDCIYEQYNQKKYIDPDPLLFLYNYPEKKDREVAGFIAASFAYGRVEMIMKTVSLILDTLGPVPGAYLKASSKRQLKDEFKGFRYRFAAENDLIDLLWGIREVLIVYGSLENCFIEGFDPDDETIVSGLQYLSDKIRGRNSLAHLLADPGKTSACKRSHLFLRWMVRNDAVDPGGWDWVSPSRLIVPLDRHMYQAGLIFGFTKRKSADFKTALEITRGFRKYHASDPVKYDFCLTRFGIRREMSMQALQEMTCEYKEL